MPDTECQPLSLRQYVRATYLLQRMLSSGRSHHASQPYALRTAYIPIKQTTINVGKNVGGPILADRFATVIRMPIRMTSYITAGDAPS